MITEKAKSLYASDESQSTHGQGVIFKASRGWLRRFMKRHGLSLRRKTTVCQATPADCIPKLVSFVMHLRQLQSQEGYGVEHMYAMDETASWFDMPSDTTVAIQGSRAVPVKTTGHEKDHFTVCLTARSDGKKMKPYIVFKGKGTRLIKQLQSIPDVVVSFSCNGWMNDSLTADYLKKIIGQLSFRKRLLVWDAYRCHISVATRAELRRLKLDSAIVPGGCTKFIQAADVSWNACFKAQMRSRYDQWIINPSLHEYTKGGNTKPPSRSLLCEWVKQAWDAVPAETVKRSFVTCAITTHLDGRDDDSIHCFKPGQPCHEGRSKLEQEMTLFRLSSNPSSQPDPFASDEDDDEMENNEMLVDDDCVDGVEYDDDDSEADDC